jgi:MSHA biogenesis protein MshE
MENKKIRIGDLLVQQGVVTEEQVNTALEKQRDTGLPLGESLIELQYLTEDVLVNTLSEQLHIPLIDLKQYSLDNELVKRMPEAYARRFRAIILEEKSSGYLIAMSNPLDINAVDEIRRVLESPVELAITKKDDLLHTLDLIYRRTDDISTFAEKLGEELSTDIPFAEFETDDDTITDTPVINLLQSVFEDAIQVGASDVHFEPDEDFLRLRLRVDGILHEQIVKEKEIAPAIALRLKLMSALDIAEKRIPQDGRFNIKVRNRVIDVRLSTMPTQFGESIVMRLLDQSGGALDLGKIGMSKEVLKRFRVLVKKPHGIFLVTGPTGSGKSTTLYGALKELNDPGTKIISIEDPVEYRMPRINQVQINEKLHLDFSLVLRTALRHDPDIIMLGEMRDKETATVAIRSALTGHMVLSTLHTNDSASSAFRLVDMDIDGFLVAATLRGVLAQRLVRKNCEGCVADYTLTDAEKIWLDGMDDFDLTKATFKQGKGCTYCNKTGYKGRSGVFELLELNEVMMQALRNNDPSTFASEAAKSLKGRLLCDYALDLASKGITSLEEVIRITGEL